MPERKPYGYVDYGIGFDDFGAYMPSPTQMKMGKIDFDMSDHIPFMKGTVDIADLVRFGRERTAAPEEFTKDFIGKDKLKPDQGADTMESPAADIDAEFVNAAEEMNKGSNYVTADDVIQAGAQLQRMGDQVSAELTEAITGGAEKAVTALFSDVSSLFFTP